jgi:uncharacterized protein (DUF934 family)
MPTLTKLAGASAVLVEDSFANIGPEDAIPASGGVILSLARFQADGEALLADGRKVGVRLEAGEDVESLVQALPRLSVVALVFPKYRDGRAFSAARLLRERYGFTGEVRAVGEVLRELANFMIRCGFDAFEIADDSTPEQWAATTRRYRHVYQRAADARAPAFVEREA